MPHVPWPAPKANLALASIDDLNDRRAFLILAQRKGALVNFARRATSSGAHP